jgi:hypothetical protein
MTPTILDKSIYSTEAFNKRHHEAATEFSKRYFESPRDIEAYDYENDTFILVDGVATYRVVFVKGIRFESVDTYQIVKEE